MVTKRVAPEDASSAVNSSTTRSNLDAEVVSTQMSNWQPLPSTVTDHARITDEQTIKSFLAKPQIVATGTFSNSDTTSSLLWTSVVPQNIIQGYNVFKDKTSGNYAFRGTTVVTVQVNANRFQQGRYILYWVPSGGTSNANCVRLHSFSLVQVTQLPRVEIDIACDTEATLRIPFVNAQGWACNYNGSSTYGNVGTVVLRPYSPLVAASGSTTAGYTILVHFEDVELAMPIHPQSGLRPSRKIANKVTPQRNEQNIAVSSKGPVESLAIKVKSAADIVSGVPLLSSFAAPVSWASNIVAQVASVFGWSKPHNTEQTTNMVRRVVDKFTNADTLDSSNVLGIHDSNELEIMPGFAGCDFDEMAISYVTSISAYFDQVDWTTSLAEGTSLISGSASPRYFYKNYTAGSQTINCLTPISYFSSLFQLYRGSIRLTFKLIKTEFHTGRLQLTFYPYDSYVASGYASPTDTTKSYILREIIDLRYGNEFSFTLPYSSFTAYRNTYSTDAAYGKWELTVLNGLVAPSTVSSTVTILVEAAAADDFELAGPVDFSGVVTTVYSPQTGGMNSCETSSGNIGGGETHDSLMPSRSCIGERVLSLRTLLKRYTVFHRSANQTLSTYLNVLPFAMSTDSVNSVASYQKDNTGPDLYTMIGSCYALFRGGIRLKVVPNDLSANYLITAASVPMDSATTINAIANWNNAVYNVANSNVYNARPFQVFRSDFSGGADVTIPFYSRLPSAAVGDFLVNSGGSLPAFNYGVADTAPRTLSYFQFSSTPSSDAFLLRSITDDSTFGLFVSVPPLTGWSPSFLG